MTIVDFIKNMLRLEKASPPRRALGELKKLQAEHQAAWKIVNVTHTEEAAKAAHRKQIQEHGTALRGAGLPARTYSLTSLIGDYASKRQAATTAMDAIRNEAIPHALELRKWAGEIVKNTTAREESQEVARHEAYGLPWSPSPLLDAMRKSVDYFKGPGPEPGPSCGSGPEYLVPFVDLN